MTRSFESKTRHWDKVACFTRVEWAVMEAKLSSGGALTEISHASQSGTVQNSTLESWVSFAKPIVDIASHYTSTSHNKVVVILSPPNLEV